MEYRPKDADHSEKNSDICTRNIINNHLKFYNYDKV